MYMPGRRRTGSRPSRTVMSFAEEDAFAGDFAIKENACKTTVLQAAESVSDRAVYGVPGEAQTDRFLHTFTEVFVPDRRGDLRREPLLVRGRRRRRRGDLCCRCRRQRPRCEPDLGDTEPPGDLVRPLSELERPQRIRRVDVEGAVTRHPCRPGIAHDRRADGRRPALEELRETRLHTEARELASQLIREPVQASPPPPARGRREARIVASP